MKKNAFLCLDDYQRPAKRKLPGPLYAYVSGGVEDNISLHDNRAAFARIYLRTEVLKDVSVVNTDIELFGHRYRAPAGIAPMGIAAMTAFQGDIALAQAARDENVPFIMSGSSLIPLEEVVSVNPQMWFQAYLPGEQEAIRALVQRVSDAGVKTLVITVDTPVKANRENNLRAGFSTPFRPSLRLALSGISHPRWLCGTLLRNLAVRGQLHFENNYATRGAPLFSRHVVRDFSGRSHISWQHLEQIRAQWQGALVIKGILSSQDAARAEALGADGIIVSNHGGRQLDTSLPPIYALPAVVAAAGNMTVMLDSGIRRGTDIIKALALGAKCCFIGRPFNYANALGGAREVRHAIRLISNEIRRDMGMMGTLQLSEIQSQHLLLRDDAQRFTVIN
ncbi:alpha-hydroxy acid oxidase [Tatumella saanichensis]|uniref:alpha-hydroxy acid oxidase n=1 Tax=Tatumella saanichensis TaxID=480813 RepID=UPI0004A4C797|nr:alpha-hydroxy acid oxidase [Tatumella saanichensis]